jgi:hypothetical protein
MTFYNSTFVLVLPLRGSVIATNTPGSVVAFSKRRRPVVCPGLRPAGRPRPEQARDDTQVCADAASARREPELDRRSIANRRHCGGSNERSAAGPSLALSPVHDSLMRARPRVCERPMFVMATKHWIHNPPRLRLLVTSSQMQLSSIVQSYAPCLYRMGVVNTTTAQEHRASTEQSTLHAVCGIQCRDAASVRTSFVFEDDLTHV